MARVALIAILLFVAPYCSAADAPKLHVPDEPSQAKAEAMIRNIFKSEYASNQPAQRRALATKLLQQARDEKTEAALRFVLYREARSVAAAAGDVVVALRAVDEMNKVFAIDSTAYKISIVQTAGRSLENQEDAAVYISAGISLVDQLTLAHDFAGASKLLSPIAIVAGQMKNPSIIAGVRRKVQQVKDTQIEFERLRALIKQPGADLAAGKIACFFDNDWPAGLGRLANCNDAKIKDAALRDLADPKAAADRMALGNTWWDIAQKQTPVARTHFEARARHWYAQALSDVGGLQRVQAEQRIASSLGAPGDATLFGGHAYTISTATYGWNEARVMCELSGGHLAYVETHEEWNFIVKFATGPDYWMGGTDQEEHGKWHWLNGKPLTFAPWHANQPDNRGGEQHFLHAYNAAWDDTAREQRCAIICEWE